MNFGTSGTGETGGTGGRVGRVGQVGQVGQVRRVERVGVRAKASECMELGMWGRLWDRWVYFSVFVVYHL